MLVSFGVFRKPNTGNNCSGKEDKLISRTLETSGPSDRFNRDAH